MNRKIDSLTSLRFWMMVIVVISHFEYLDISEIYNRYFHGRHILATLVYFFALSGFGLAYSNKDIGKVTVKSSIKFAIGRMKKIWPIYVVVLVACIPYNFYWFAEKGVALTSAVPTILGKLLVCLPFLQSTTGMTTFSRGINDSCWFLSTLFIIYMCAPIILKINKKIKHTVKKDLALLAVNLLLMIVTYKIFEMIESRTFFDDLAHSSPYIRIYAFIAGVLIADLVKCFKWKNKVYIHIFEIVVVASWILWVMNSDVTFIDSLMRCVIELVLICMLIYACTLENGFIDKILSSRWNVKLGEITIYIYMIHYPVRVNVDWLWKNIFPRTLVGGIIESCLIIIITFAIIAIIQRKGRKAVTTKIQKQ